MMEIDDKMMDYFRACFEEERNRAKKFYHRKEGEEERLQDEIERGAALTKIGVMSAALICVLVLFSGATRVSETIAFLFLYAVIYLVIAIKIGGLKQWRVKGFGAAAKLIVDMSLAIDDIDEINDLCSRKELPAERWFLSHSLLNREEKSRLYSALEKDFKTLEDRPYFEVYDDIFSVFNSNAGYIGLFFCMGWVYLFLFFLVGGLVSGSESGLGVIFAIALVEEGGKGIGFFITKTLNNPPRLGGTYLPNTFGKGMVAGCGFAFIETFVGLSTGNDPVFNLIVRIPALLLHIVASGIFFTGIGITLGEYKKKTPWKKWALRGGGLMLVGVVIHFMFNIGVVTLFG